MPHVDVELKMDPKMRQELDRKWSCMGLMLGHTWDWFVIINESSMRSRTASALIYEFSGVLI